MIREGRVRLNGLACRDPEHPVHSGRDKIVVDAAPLKASSKIYLMMNKPRGVVTTASDEQGRETVYDVLRKASPVREKDGATSDFRWVAPVGRLDKASEGLLLLTNDSAWGARVAAPETHLAKTYHVQIAASADDEFVRALVAGIQVGAGKQRQHLSARKARLLRSGKKNCWLEIILDEGKNRQIRRMMAVLGVEVLRLVRVAIGPLQLGNLAKGACRALTSEERQSIDRAMLSLPAQAEFVAHG